MDINPFFNPITGLPFLKNYIFDPGRLEKLSPEKMKKYRNKVLRKAVRYAYSVPVYHKKYKAAGVTPDDIRGVDDLVKLPLITRKDLVNNFPDGIIPNGYNKEKGYVVSTSGSSGRPVSIYIDFPTISKAFCLSIRQGRNYNFNFRKVKIASIGTFLDGRIDNVFEKAFISKTNTFRRTDGYLSMNAFDPIKNIVKKLNNFKPDIIYIYPVTLQHLAYFKRKGLCENINPKLLQVGGYSIDEYTKNYIEEAFKCKVINLYQSVEAVSDIAFECFDGTWHVNHDFYHVEAIDENMNLVAPGEKGHIVITRMFGRGTPIIRYTGMDDWVTLKPDYECSCGLRTPILENGVEGRISERIILPDGRVYPAASFAIISLILKNLGTYKVTQFQIVQKKIDEIEILLVIDDDLRDTGPSVDLIFNKIKEAYEEKVGHKVKITVKEVDKIKSAPNKPLPIVVSNISLEDGYKALEKE